MKQRADKGVSRGKYTKNMGSRYRSFISKCNSYECEVPYTEEEYMQILSNPCYYCGSSVQVGLARVNMNDDFNRDNIRCCCRRCQSLKFGYHEREFLSIINAISKHMKDKYYDEY